MCKYIGLFPVKLESLPSKSLSRKIEKILYKIDSCFNLLFHCEKVIACTVGSITTDLSVIRGINSIADFIVDKEQWIKRYCYTKDVNEKFFQENEMIIQFVQDNLFVLLILLINLLVSLIYLIINNEKMKNNFNKMNIILQKLFVVLFVGPLFVSPFLTQPRMNYSHWSIVVLSILITMIGALMIIFSFLKMGIIPSIKTKSGLSTSGTYKIVRHPIYSGTIITFIGLIILMKAYLSLVYFSLSILLYYIMTIFEEKDLIKMYGEDYISYCKVVKKRIIPFIL